MKPTSWFQSVNLAIEGIIFSIKTQRHMRYHLVTALAVLVLGLVLNITRSDFVLLSLAIILVLVTELLNTAIERTVDMIATTYDIRAKIVKDIGAGVVLIASFGALILAYFILYPAVRSVLLSGQWRLRRAPNDVVAFVSLAAVIIVVMIVKALLGRGEPLRGGMPSGHAAVSFSIWSAAFFLSESLPVVVLTFLLAVMVSWSRWSSGIHRASEVIVGALLGTGLTFLLFWLFT